MFSVVVGAKLYWFCGTSIKLLYAVAASTRYYNGFYKLATRSHSLWNTRGPVRYNTTVGCRPVLLTFAMGV